jgi:hypothetical protein
VCREADLLLALRLQQEEEEAQAQRQQRQMYEQHQLQQQQQARTTPMASYATQGESLPILSSDFRDDKGVDVFSIHWCAQAL